MVQTNLENKITPEQFCYWLQGKLEGREVLELSHEELKSIRDHLQEVFTKVTPTYTTTTTDGTDYFKKDGVFNIPPKCDPTDNKITFIC